MYDFYKEIEKIYLTLDSSHFNGFITGDGPLPCDLLFIGEAPGKYEVQEGRPFVGLAGKTFETYLEFAGIKRSDIRITNTCYGRPVKMKVLKNNKISYSNRTPLKNEISIFNDILDKEIELCKPKVIVSLGNTPLKRLYGQVPISSCHGVPIFLEKYNSYLFPMFHPSALTYNRGEEFKNIYMEDWSNLAKFLENFRTDLN